MNNTKRRSNCQMRFANGNCGPMGGFCTSNSNELCEAMQNAYRIGREHIINEVLQKSSCVGCRHYDEEHTERICFVCKRACEDRYEE